MSSHQLGEVALVSDRIAFLHEGRLVRYGRLDELLAAGEVEIVLRNFTADAEFAAQWGEEARPGGGGFRRARCGDFLKWSGRTGLSW